METDVKRKILRGAKENRTDRPFARRGRTTAASIVFLTALVFFHSAPAASAEGLLSNAKDLFDDLTSGELDLGLGNLDIGNVDFGNIGSGVTDALHSGLDDALDSVHDAVESIGGNSSISTPDGKGTGTANTGAGNTSDTGLNLPERVVSKAEERRRAMEDRLNAAAEEAGLGEKIENAAENIRDGAEDLRNRIEETGEDLKNAGSKSQTETQLEKDLKEQFDNLRKTVQEEAKKAGLSEQEIKELTDAINEAEKLLQEDAGEIRTAIEEKRLEKLIEDLKKAIDALGGGDKSFLERLVEWLTGLRERRGTGSSSTTDWAALLGAQGNGSSSAVTATANHSTAIPNEEKEPKEEEEPTDLEVLEPEAVPLTAYREPIVIQPDRKPWYRSFGVIAAGIAALGAVCMLTGMAVGRKVKKKP